MANESNKELIDLKKQNVLDITSSLLEKSMDSSGALDGAAYDDQNIQFHKTTLGFLNAHLKALDLGVQIYKIQNIDEKIKAIEEKGKK